MTIMYSPTGGFYSTVVHTKEQIPEDAIEITDELHEELLKGQSNGKLIKAGKKGKPTLVDQPADSSSELILRANEEIMAQIAKIELEKQPRALREATLTGDTTRLKAIDDEITALRAQLK